MKELTPSGRSLLFMLVSKYKRFSRNYKLAGDGSFYYPDQRLAEELFVSVRTILRAKRALVKHGYIKVENGIYKGHATKYWIMTKHDKMSGFNLEEKTDNLSVKDVNLSAKACQNVIPNKINKAKNKKEDTVFNGYEEEPQQDLRNLTDKQKEDIRSSVAFCGSKEKTVDFFVRKGYPQDVLEEVLKGL